MSTEYDPDYYAGYDHGYDPGYDPAYDNGNLDRAPSEDYSGSSTLIKAPLAGAVSARERPVVSIVNPFGMPGTRFSKRSKLFTGRAGRSRYA